MIYSLAFVTSVDNIIAQVFTFVKLNESQFLLKKNIKEMFKFLFHWNHSHNPGV